MVLFAGSVTTAVLIGDQISIKKRSQVEQVSDYLLGSIIHLLQTT
jgi:hypothetical protein